MFWPLFVLHVVSAELFESFSGVWELNKKSFDEALETQPNLLIEFYSERCSSCQEFSPYYNGFGEYMLKNEGIHIARIDIELEPFYKTAYYITEVPTLMMFVSGTNFKYSGQRNTTEIYRWMKQLTSKPLQMFSSYAEINSANFTNVTLIYFGDASHKYRQFFNDLFQTETDIDFGYIKNLRSIHLKEYAPGVLLKRENKEEIFQLTNNSVDLVQFIALNRGLHLHDWTHKTKVMMIQDKLNGLVFFVSEKDKEKHLSTINDLAKEFHRDLIISTTDLEQESDSFLENFIGLKPKAQPFALIIDFRSESKKYLELNFTYESLQSFVKNWKKGKLKPYYKSQDSSEIRTEKGLRVLTGFSFDTVFDGKFSYFVFFYKTYGSDSQKYLKIFERAAYEQKNRTDIVFMKYDMELNELEGLNLPGVPAVRLYTKDNKEGFTLSGYLGKFTLFRMIRDNLANP